MQTLFKLAYSLAVAILLVLVVILGTRTFYDEPDPPTYPYSGGFKAEKPGEEIYCDPDDRCFKGGVEITPEEEASLTDAQRDFIEAQREFNRLQRKYEDDRADYHRNVFILASILGIAAIAGGLYLFRRVEAVPLGLVLGGIGVVNYGWAQAAGDFDEIGMAPLFVVALIGLAILLACGYWFLGIRGPQEGEGG